MSVSDLLATAKKSANNVKCIVAFGISGDSGAVIAVSETCRAFDRMIEDYHSDVDVLFQDCDSVPNKHGIYAFSGESSVDCDNDVYTNGVFVELDIPVIS